MKDEFTYLIKPKKCAPWNGTLFKVASESPKLGRTLLNINNKVIMKGLKSFQERRKFSNSSSKDFCVEVLNRR